MALLGGRKKQTFGQVPMPGGYQGGTGIGDGMIERQQMGAPVQGMGQLPDVANLPDMGGMQQQQPAKFKPNLIGVIGDAMQVFGGGQATYMNSVREQQQRAELMRERAMLAQQERQTGWQDWVAKENYKRENPEPGNPHYWEMNDGSLGRIGPNGQPEVVYKDPTPKTTYITADNGDGTKTFVPVVNGVPQMGGPARPQVGAVITDPRKKGGPVQQSPGNFPNG